MENATEALHMGVSVIIFVIALSISIAAFGQARQTTQTVLEYRDREYDYSYVQYKQGVTKRIVRAETMVPSIYRAYKENYKIVFEGLDEPLYEKAIPGGMEKIYTIDLATDVSGSDEEKERFIRCLLYGSKYTAEIEEFKKSGIYLNGRDFYDIIKGNNFEESIGVYYPDEIQGQSNTPNANQEKKRVLTYTKNN